VDWTVEAQKLLSAVARGQRLHPAGLTVPQVVQMVQGIPGGEMTRLGLDRLSTFGILPQAQAKDLEASLALLVEEHCLRHGPGRPATLLLDHAARPVLFSGAKLLRWERQPITPAPPRPSLPTPSDNALLDALKQVRSQLARKSGLPPYVIFSNLVLQNIALRHPRTKAELLQVSGVSQAKADRYSAPLLEVLNRF
ncbi:MAG TPA: hypothetical protein DIT49_05285, partial [Clostridiales bacterium]|nr:hypothetical protein [Clostridiales bacterium]